MALTKWTAALLFVGATSFLIILGIRIVANSERSALPPGFTSTNIVTREAWIAFSPREKLETMERLGFVPLAAGNDDLHLAERTSWWGRRVKPDAFWGTNEVSLDATTISAANRLGRRYPPVPSRARLDLSETSDSDRAPRRFSLEFPQIHFVYSDRESIYWDVFRRQFPKSPRDLQLYHEITGAAFFERTAQSTNSPKVPPPYAVAKELRIRDADLGFPPELYETNALRWGYILHQRTRFQDYFNGTASAAFFVELKVPPSLITNPLSPAHIHEANHWKKRYLVRLAREKMHDNHIPAYLQAWGLTSNHVFGTSEPR